MKADPLLPLKHTFKGLPWILTQILITFYHSHSLQASKACCIFIYCLQPFCICYLAYTLPSLLLAYYYHYYLLIIHYFCLCFWNNTILLTSQRDRELAIVAFIVPVESCSPWPGHKALVFTLIFIVPAIVSAREKRRNGWLFCLVVSIRLFSKRRPGLWMPTERTCPVFISNGQITKQNIRNERASSLDFLLAISRRLCGFKGDKNQLGMRFNTSRGTKKLRPIENLWRTVLKWNRQSHSLLQHSG